jgi:hypothetical protein
MGQERSVPDPSKPNSNVSRRSLLAFGAATRLPTPTNQTLHPFAAWLAERRLLEQALDRTPEETQAATRERLLDRTFELEGLILNTPSDELRAMRVKAAMLVWLLEMEGCDGLGAMRHIKAFLDHLT